MTPEEITPADIQEIASRYGLKVLSSEEIVAQGGSPDPERVILSRDSAEEPYFWVFHLRNVSRALVEDQLRQHHQDEPWNPRAIELAPDSPILEGEHPKLYWCSGNYETGEVVLSTEPHREGTEYRLRLKNPKELRFLFDLLYVHLVGDGSTVWLVPWGSEEES